MRSEAPRVKHSSALLALVSVLLMSCDLELSPDHAFHEKSGDRRVDFFLNRGCLFINEVPASGRNPVFT